MFFNLLCKKRESRIVGHFILYFFCFPLEQSLFCFLKSFMTLSILFLLFFFLSRHSLSYTNQCMLFGCEYFNTNFHQSFLLCYINCMTGFVIFLSYFNLCSFEFSFAGCHFGMKVFDCLSYPPNSNSRCHLI